MPRWAVSPTLLLIGIFLQGRIEGHLGFWWSWWCMVGLLFVVFYLCMEGIGCSRVSFSWQDKEFLIESQHLAASFLSLYLHVRGYFLLTGYWKIGMVMLFVLAICFLITTAKNLYKSNHWIEIWFEPIEVIIK